MGQHHIGRHVMWRKGLELGVRRPSFSVWFIFSFMTNSLRAYQTLSPMLRSGKLKIEIEIIKNNKNNIIMLVIIKFRVIDLC